MKHIVFPLLFLFLMMPVSHAMAQTVPGDMDGNNAVDLFDTVRIINVVLERAQPTREADVNLDTDINIVDVLLCANIAVGNPTVAFADPLIIPNAAGQVTIRGGNFDPVANNNVVVINGVTTAVDSVEIVGGQVVGLNVTIQGGSTSGGIQVTSGGISAISNPQLTIGGHAYSINDVTITEGTGAGTVAMTFTVSAGISSLDIRSVRATATPGSATATGPNLGDADFSPVATDLVFNRGDATQRFTVQVAMDSVNESDVEIFTVELTSPQISVNGNFVTDTQSTILDRTGIGRILDDDDSEISIADQTVAEGAGTMSFVVSVTNPSSNNILVTASTADNNSATADVDYVAKSQTVTIMAGQTMATFDVTVNDDQVEEKDETFLVNLSNPIGNSTTSISVGTATGTIVDNDIFDFNGDGLPDTISGAPEARVNGEANVGKVYIVFGTTTPNASLDLATLNSNEGVSIVGAATGSLTGGSVSGIGDFNGDGISDAIIGSSDLNSAYILYGSRTPFTAVVELASLTPSQGLVITGQTVESVAGAGDFNGDGLADVLLGIPSASPFGLNRAGLTYLVFGTRTQFQAPFSLANLAPNRGAIFVGSGANSTSGRSVASAGDFNRDGLADFLIGADGATTNGNLSSGRTYVIYGTQTPFATFVQLSQLQATQGVIINGAVAGQRIGFSVSKAGDFNGDNLPDIIIGAQAASPNGNNQAGTAIIVFGSQTPMTT
ncbi:MAG: Calx-beta domain-containing protein, partial [Planctomycetota bacterium]|nr:Calx-beta domain-containing protein [Planctomycetota bacterium]